MLIEYRANGQRREVADAVAQNLIDRRIARAVDGVPAPEYKTRAMAVPAPGAVLAPYGFKADGTPRKRPAPPPRNLKSEG